MDVVAAVRDVGRALVGGVRGTVAERLAQASAGAGVAHGSQTMDRLEAAFAESARRVAAGRPSNLHRVIDLLAFPSDRETMAAVHKKLRAPYARLVRLGGEAGAALAAVHSYQAIAAGLETTDADQIPGLTDAEALALPTMKPQAVQLAKAEASRAGSRITLIAGLLQAAPLLIAGIDCSASETNTGSYRDVTMKGLRIIPPEGGVTAEELADMIMVVDVGLALIGETKAGDLIPMAGTMFDAMKVPLKQLNKATTEKLKKLTKFGCRLEVTLEVDVYTDGNCRDYYKTHTIKLIIPPAKDHDSAGSHWRYQSLYNYLTGTGIARHRNAISKKIITSIKEQLDDRYPD